MSPLTLALLGGQSLLGYLNTRQQTGANDRALAAQTAAANRAIDLQRDIYGQTRTDLSPWRDQGAQATTALANRIGLNVGVQPRSVGAGQSPAAAQNGQLVTLQAPDGSTRQVPSWQAPRYLAAGARQVA